jgi:CRP-like cAMP-binding protein
MATPLRNHLLKQLAAAEYERLSRVLEPVELAFKEPLFEQGKPVTHVWFIESGVASNVTQLVEADDFVETGTIGREGFVGLPVFFGTPIASSRCFIQVTGFAYRVSASTFTELIPTLPQLSGSLLRYTSSFLTMVAQSAACNRMHVVEARLARWLLMTHDRVDSDEVPLTQEFLGHMLGVRRPAVSIAGATLQKAGLIRYSRGKIAVLDRAGLEEASCECYAHVKRVYESNPASP